ncbi:hypothetical protein Tco_0952837 [Tanacetum coccineum]|uniref:Secreted protein n=1 Tax=Tanacetum coccineum TaxID=301880 RepID=A0ABQ5DYX6_9ASTR
MPPKRTSTAARAAARAAAATAAAAAAAAALMTAATVEQLIEARVSAALANHDTLRNSTNGHGDEKRKLELYAGTTIKWLPDKNKRQNTGAELTPVGTGPGCEKRKLREHYPWGGLGPNGNKNIHRNPEQTQMLSLVRMWCSGAHHERTILKL